MKKSPSIHIRDGFPNQRFFTLPRALLEKCRRMPIVKNLIVSHTGYFPTARHHYIHRPNGTKEHIVIHCTDGKGWCRIRKKRFALSRGWTIFIPAHMEHSYGADLETPWSIWWAHFTGSESGIYMKALGVTAESPMLYIRDNMIVSRLFEDVYSHIQHGQSDKDLLGMTTSFARLLGMLNAEQNPQDQRLRHAQDKILMAIEFMQANLAKAVTLGEVAKASGFSVPHFCNLFSRQTNTSPGMFMIRLKMQKACELLLTTDLQMSEISGRIGYDDQFYFSRIFSRVMGLSPSSYRKANSQKREEKVK